MKGLIFGLLFYLLGEGHKPFRNERRQGMEKKNIDAKPFRKEEVEKIMMEVDKKLEEFIKSGKYKDVLIMMGNLGKYSLTNQIYILLQNPNASFVNGMKGWNYLGRSIKKDEKAIKIFAPVKTVEDVMLEDEDGKYITDEDGAIKTRKMTVVKGYKPSFVFDVSQTKGKDIKAFKMDDKTTVEEKELIKAGLMSVVAKEGYSVSYASKEELGQGCYGLCNHKEKKILLLDGMSDLQEISTLVHECGHALAHNPYKAKFEGVTALPNRDIKEVEAESIACVVCSHLGLNTKDFNFSYITGWADGDITKFRKNMDVISRYSLELINGIDKAFIEDKKLKAKLEREKEKSKTHEEAIRKPRPVEAVAY